MMYAPTALGTNGATAIREVSPQEREYAERREAARAERAALEAEIAALSDEELARRLGDALEAIHVAEGTDDRVAATRAHAAHAPLIREYTRRQREGREMPPIPQPTHIPAYMAQQEARRLRELGRGWPGGQIIPQVFITPYAQLVGYGRTRPLPLWRSASLIGAPLLGGYLAHRRSAGSVVWTGAGALGGAALATLVPAALFFGAMFAGGGARY
jgi:hypothetical protein